MALSRRVLGAGLLAASGAAVAGTILIRRGGPSNAEVVEGATSAATAPFLSDPETVEALGQTQMRAVCSQGEHLAGAVGRDFVCTNAAALGARPIEGARTVLFASPVVVYTRATLAEALVEAGLVSKDQGRFDVDARLLLQAVEAGRTWSELGVPDRVGAVTLACDDPTRSDQAFAFAALAIGVLGANPALFARTTPVESFDALMSAGRGGAPLQVGLENDLAAWIAADPERWLRLQAGAGGRQLVALYPRPTLLLEQVLVARTPLGERLGQALTSEPLQAIGWRRHGFRSPQGEVGTGLGRQVAERLPSRLPALAALPEPSALAALRARLVRRPPAATGG